MREARIDGKSIGSEHSPYVVAEMSANHNGDIERAFRIIEAAKAAGADAIKLQTYTADTITLDHDGPGFVIEGGLWHGRKLHELYSEGHTPWDWHPALFARAREVGISVFSSPFDPSAVDFLEELGCPAYKIASFELVDLPLVERCARTGKPLIMSVGMANLGEIDAAVRRAREAGCSDLVLLHCISGYPTPARDMNLRTMVHLAEAFDVTVGLSDHTMGTAVSVAAVGLGATLIEKHFTLCRADGGLDSSFSLEPSELASLVTEVRLAHEALGRVTYTRPSVETASRPYRRSLYAACDIAAGEPISNENVRSVRPGFGLPPSDLPKVVGMRARGPIGKGTPLSWSLLE